MKKHKLFSAVLILVLAFGLLQSVSGETIEVEDLSGGATVQQEAVAETASQPIIIPEAPKAEEAASEVPAAKEAETAAPATTEELTTEPIATEEPTAEPVASEEPTAEPIVTEEPTAEPTVTEEPVAEATPAEATPAELTPAEEIPSEATPAEATPAEATPAEATPAEATPDEEIEFTQGYAKAAAGTKAYATSGGGNLLGELTHGAIVYVRAKANDSYYAISFDTQEGVITAYMQIDHVTPLDEDEAAVAEAQAKAQSEVNSVDGHALLLTEAFVPVQEETEEIIEETIVDASDLITFSLVLGESGEIAYGETFTIVADASAFVGDSAATYQWQVTTDGAASWANIEGATATELSVLFEGTNAHWQYRILATIE